MARLPRLTSRSPDPKSETPTSAPTKRRRSRPEAPVTSLLDVDFYKFTMAQFVFRRHREVRVRYRLLCRTPDAALARRVPVEAFREALEGARGLSFAGAELEYLRSGISPGLFGEDFLRFLAALRLPPVAIAAAGDRGGEGFDLEVEAPWPNLIFWETIILATLSELLTRAALAGGGAGAEREAEERGRERLARKIALLRRHPGIRFASFGTRRRFSRRWQLELEERLAAELPGQFVGTSSVLSARRLGQRPIGTVAHEVFMVGAVLGDGSAGGPGGAAADAEIAGSPLRTADAWWEMYGEPYSLFLTDTWGSESWFRGVGAARARRFRGVRHDSGDPAAFGERVLRWYGESGIDPRRKALVFSDGLEVEDLVALHQRFAGRIRVSFGWGTNLTNDCGVPTFSLVVKPVEANGRPLVKLSDDAGKSTGDPAEVARYRRIFDCPAVAGPPPRY